MGENDVKLIEQTLTHNTNDIREIEKKVETMEKDISDLKANQLLTNQMMVNVTETLTTLKTDFRSMDDKMDDNNKDIQSELRQNSEKMLQNQIEQLGQYKSTIWKVGGSIVGSIVVAVILFFLKL